MLSERAVKFLSALSFRPDAERLGSLLPLGGIYWADEIPDFETLLKVPEQDRNLIYRLFSIRFKIWDGETLSEVDQDFWDMARSQAPNYPLFQRLELSADDKRAQDQVEQDAVEGFRMLFAQGDKVEITEHEHGTKSFAITIDLTKNQTGFAQSRAWLWRVWSWIIGRRIER